MRATGNGHPQRCAENLLAITRGEVPYERIKGLDARTVDKPEADAAAMIRTDVAFVLETYEPRVTLAGVAIAREENGDYKVTASTKANE